MPRPGPVTPLLVAAALAAGIVACHPESAMPTAAAATDPPAAVRAAAAAARGWDEGDVEVGQVDGLDRAGCRFYRASNPKRLDEAPVEFVALADGAVVGGDREATRARIGAVLRDCGTDAPAAWWAQVVSRFAGSGGVLVDAHAPSAIRKLRDAGVDDPAPRLRQDGDATALRYFTHDYDRGTLREVNARLGADGQLAVDTREIGAD